MKAEASEEAAAESKVAIKSSSNKKLSRIGTFFSRLSTIFMKKPPPEIVIYEEEKDTKASEGD